MNSGVKTHMTKAIEPELVELPATTDLEFITERTLMESKLITVTDMTRDIPTQLHYLKIAYATPQGEVSGYRPVSKKAYETIFEPMLFPHLYVESEVVATTPIIPKAPVQEKELIYV